LCYSTVIGLILIVYFKDSTNTALIIYIGTVVNVIRTSVQRITKVVFANADYKAVKKELFNIIEHLDTIERTDEFQTYSLKNVNYKYNGSEKCIIIDDFTVNKGETIVITGESGQGKTTLLNILTGYLEPDNCIKLKDNQETSVYLDGVIVTQDIELFDLTLRDNLTLGKEISDDKILSMIEEVGLLDWFNSLTNGLDTYIGERGNRLSVGQTQRLSLLRGLLMDKEVYFFDEPTSNLDVESEEKIVKLFKRVLKNKTCIIITHRPALLSLATKHYEYKDSKLQREDI
jgi:ABC-type transport system involved in cytochrome bd biosynthesis fused ATPase/permease subunit